MNVVEWLRALGLEQYEAAFRENDVDAEVLPTLTADELKDIGVSSIRHRRRLLEAIAVLRSKSTPADDPVGLSASPTREFNSSVPTAERRPLSVMFCDLVGSTALSSRLDPEDLREVIRAYQAHVSTTIRRFDGFIARYVGDGVLIYFGWPEARETDAERAVRAGLAVAAEIGAAAPIGGEPLQVRIGIATGLVVIGEPIGSGDSRQQTAVGETPNLAARLQGVAGPGHVVIDAASRRQIGRLFECQDLGTVELKGLPVAVPAWRVLGEGLLESRFEALRGNPMMPLIGREAELERLLRRWRQAAAGEGQVILLAGEPGIGKSRLLAELEARLATETHLSLRYFCSPLHQGSALYPVIARWQQDARFAPGDTAEQRLTKLESVLAPDGLSPTDVALLAVLLGVPTGERYPSPDLSPQRRKELTFALLQRRVACLAQRHTVLMLFEDAHWADPSSLELFDTLISRITELPILLVISFRPEFVSSWIGRAGVSLITLTRLDRRHSAALAAQVTMAHVLTHSILERIIAQTDGVPLFIEELTKAILETATDGSTAALAVPSTLQASLLARLDRFPAARQVAQIGAVIGREFAHILLTNVARLTGNELTKGLDELVAAGLVFRRGLPPEATYTFKHALVQETAYESLLRARRQQIHRQIAESVRDQLPERANAEPEIVAHHFTEAGLPASAIEWWGKAGERSLRRSALSEAISHFGSAIALAEKLNDNPTFVVDRLRLQVAYGQALMAAKGYGAPETTAAFARARDLAAGIEDVTERFSVFYGLWVGSFIRGELPPMRELAAAFLSDVDGRAEAPEASSAHRVFGLTRWFEGNFHEAQKHLDRAVALSDGETDRALAFRFGQGPRTAALLNLAITVAPLGELIQARRLLERARTQGQQSAHIPTIAYMHGQTCLVEGVCRDTARTTPHARMLGQLSREHGLQLWTAVAAFFDQWVRWRSGDREVETSEMVAAVSLFRTSFQPLVPLATVLLAEVQGDTGRVDVGLSTLDDLLLEIDRTGQRWFDAEIHRGRGELLRRTKQGDEAAAGAAFEQAIKISRSQGSKLFELRATANLACLLRDLGRRTEARDVLSPICSWFVERHDTLEVQQAKALLQELA
jgi:class 3 adenylate cyclase/tetratricopeptide (TPR) repeat protein